MKHLHAGQYMLVKASIAGHGRRYGERSGGEPPYSQRRTTVEKIARFGLIVPLGDAVAVLAVVLILGASPALAFGGTPKITPAAQDPQARSILLDMANFLAKVPAFSVTMRSGYDAIQADGQRIEFGGRRRILLQRPDRFRVEAERSDGDRGLILFDGRAITAFRAEDNVYARVEKPGTLDDAMVYMVRDLQMTLPMARMFLTGFPQDLEKLITSIRYVEENFLFDVPTDHLAVRSAEVDLQVWIAQGDRPLPRRVVITYKNEPGQPQFRADFSDWDLSPKLTADSFVFTPPAGAEQIPLLAPVRRQGSPPMQKGGQQ
jgi:hypothetical protein